MSTLRISLPALLLPLAAVVVLSAPTTAPAADEKEQGAPHVCAKACMHETGVFKGAKANTGHVTFSTDQNKKMLTLSDDFKVPDAPAPHWQVIDSHGNVYLLQRLVVKGDKLHKTITLPAYIHDVVTVQIWCAWAESLLGEARFDMSVGS